MVNYILSVAIFIFNCYNWYTDLHNITKIMRKEIHGYTDTRIYDYNYTYNAVNMKFIIILYIGTYIIFILFNCYTK